MYTVRFPYTFRGGKHLTTLLTLLTPLAPLAFLALFTPLAPLALWETPRAAFFIYLSLGYWRIEKSILKLKIEILWIRLLEN